MIAKDAKGFYCVSSLGVTGTRKEIKTDVSSMVKLVKEANDIPCAIGFGIIMPVTFHEMALQSDGAIVGSAIVKICEKYGAESVPYVAEYVKQMKEAVSNYRKLSQDRKFICQCIANFCKHDTRKDVNQNMLFGCQS